MTHFILTSATEIKISYEQKIIVNNRNIKSYHCSAKAISKIIASKAPSFEISINRTNVTWLNHVIYGRRNQLPLSVLNIKRAWILGDFTCILF